MPLKAIEQRDAKLAAKLKAEYDDPTKYIPIDVLHKIIARQIGKPGVPVKFPEEKNKLDVGKRIYGGIVQAKDGVLQGKMSDFGVDFQESLTKFKQYVEKPENKEHKIDQIDFVLFDQTRGHFTRLSVAIVRDPPEEEKIFIDNLDSHVLSDDEQKASDPHQKLQKAIAGAVKEKFPGYEIKQEYAAAEKQQTHNNCADFVLSDLLSRRHVQGAKISHPDLYGDDETKKRAALVQIMQESLTDEEIALLVTPDQGEAPSVTETSPNKTSTTSSYEAIVNSAQTMCESLKKSGNNISLATDSEGKPRITRHGDDASTVFLNVTSVNNPMTQEETSEEVALTRTQDSHGVAHRSCGKNNLPWEKQCEIFAAQAEQDYGQQANVVISAITCPGKEEPDNAAMKLKDCDGNTPKLSKQERTLLVSYLKFANSVTYQGKQYNASDNNALLQKSAVADTKNSTPSVAKNPHATFAQQPKSPVAADTANLLVKGEAPPPPTK